MQRYASPILLLALGLAAALAPAQAAQRKEAEPPAPQFTVDGPTRLLGFEKAVLTIPSSTVLGEYSLESLCSNPKPLYISDVFSGMSAKDYADVFILEAKAADYQLAGRQGSGDLFGGSDERRPDLIVGAAITGLKEKVCARRFLNIFNLTLDATITIDWQVFDPLQRQTVFRTTNQGTVQLKKDQLAGTIPAEGALEAFRAAAKDILADPGFVAALKIPGAAASQSQPAVSRTEIPQVPLRTVAFGDQIPDLRRQVVTVITGEATGSGFYIADGLVVTNHHVVEGYKNLKLRFFGGREILGEVLMSDPRRDVALIKAPGGGMLGLPVRLDRPPVGAQVFVIGSPLGEEQEGTITSGIVSAYRVRDSGPVLQSDVAVTHGNSGGPMFDDKGNVVALVVAGLMPEGVQIGLNFFIPVDDALRTLGVSIAGVPMPQAARVPDTGQRAIQVSMYPADGPLKKSGRTQAVPGTVAGVGTAGTFTFNRPDGVSCDGRWTTLESKPQSGSLMDKYRDAVGIAADPAGMVGGLAIGSCSNGGTFQAEYYVVPGIDSGFGAAADSDGNIYKVIF